MNLQDRYRDLFDRAAAVGHELSLCVSEGELEGMMQPDIQVTTVGEEGNLASGLDVIEAYILGIETH